VYEFRWWQQKFIKEHWTGIISNNQMRKYVYAALMLMATSQASSGESPLKSLQTAEYVWNEIQKDEREYFAGHQKTAKDIRKVFVERSYLTSALAKEHGILFLLTLGTWSLLGILGDMFLNTYKKYRKGNHVNN
jgi:hypothetical protein